MNTQVDSVVRCLPVGICSFNYVFDSADHPGGVNYNWATERGSIQANGHTYEVDKSGIFDPTWTMLENGHALFTSKSMSVFGRTYAFAGQSQTAVLRAVSMFGSSLILEGSRVECTFQKEHLFTRRSYIRGHWHDFRFVAFAFWFYGLILRRSASSSSGSS